MFHDCAREVFRGIMGVAKEKAERELSMTSRKILNKAMSIRHEFQRTSQTAKTGQAKAR